jgi:hypothetical protein
MLILISLQYVFFFKKFATVVALVAYFIFINQTQLIKSESGKNAFLISFKLTFLQFKGAFLTIFLALT